MSAAAVLWKQIFSTVETIPRALRSTPAMIVNSVAEPSFSLMHQLFFPAATLRRTSILFATAEPKFNHSSLCERLAIALSNISGEMVGIVEAGAADDFFALKKKNRTSADATGWQACTVPVSERVRKIPFELVSKGYDGEIVSKRDGLRGLPGPFEYFLLSASVAGSEMPVLCNLCDAAVLVLTANMTRREAARRAKEQLIRQGVTLLGTVLDQRTMPIPESIYRRL